MGINMIPKESLNSPFNNPAICSVKDPFYEDVFGFTQEEVDDALFEYDLLGKRNDVKRWYDGYKFGDRTGMYNPYSICYMIGNRKTGMYWSNTASNDIVSLVVKNGSKDLKDEFLTLMTGGTISSRKTLWVLLLACGYLKATDMEENRYSLAIVNHEVMEMMDDLVLRWFSDGGDDSAYNGFIDAVTKCDEEGMQESLSTLSLELMGSLDMATKENSKDVENFYHGFVLGLVASTRGRYSITSNRESGKGRYDIMMEPLDKFKDNGIIIEFKIFNPKEEESLEGTCLRALNQIDDKKYDVELKKHGIPDERIAKFGIGYSGKEVLVRKRKTG